MLLFLRAQRARSWPPDELVRDLRATLLIVTDALESLQKSGLVGKSENERYRYWPATPELDEVVTEVSGAYASSPASVIEAILSAPSSSVRIFADAFKIKEG